MRCAACGGENAVGMRFCEDCGSPLPASCPSCGQEVSPGKRFCGHCGASIGANSAAATASSAAAPSLATSAEAFPADETALSPGTGTEVRHVSVLFCDLVGFTPLSESKDPEEVRELLSGYFELARSIVGRYGGVIQKFIGDAVMAVWGAPITNEDDAERAVRAGLELVSAVAVYGKERGIDLEARVGIVTGEAATTETAEEGLVIGDRVNTAARIQSVAPPGCCYVDETTRAATAPAIAYVDAGSHELKGKAEPLRLYEATRVIAAVAGSQRANVLEAPFTGRDHELRLVKELFHAAAERHSARLVLVSGVAGVGKSRLGWEFFKYIDGLAGTVLWHAGRCLSYGEGVSYWALSEMVRARLQIGEEDPQEVAAERLRTGLERWIPEAADREFISPRIGQLLGLPSSQVLAREELFSGWRLFFERLAEHEPVVMVVEDLQWADAGMVAFLDHLLEWSADHALFLLVLTRPEGIDKRGLVLGRRNLTALSLDPLSDEVIGELLDRLVADLPSSPRARIVERAEGIPLYAVETVRSLLDSGVLAKRPDGALHLVGELGALEIPPGLTALIASRLDALSPDERRLVKECSVLGESFSRQAVEAVTDSDPSNLDELLSTLVRKEVLAVRADKLSPERGHYAFTQSLIRSVAYDMLSKAERKGRHLRTAAHLREVFADEGTEVAEVIAAHLNDAYRAAGEDADTAELRAQAREAYVLAAERAESVGAPEAAEGAYAAAAELSTDEADRAQLIEKRGRMAFLTGALERAVESFEDVVAVHQAAGRLDEAARVSGWLGRALASSGRGEQAIALLRTALASLDPDTAPVAVVAALQEHLGRSLVFSARLGEGAELIEEALTLAQHHELAETLAYAMGSRALFLDFSGRLEEARVGYEAAIAMARLQGLTRAEMNSENNLADLSMNRDLPGAEENCQAMLDLARRWGARMEESMAVQNLMCVLTMAGRFDEAERIGLEVLESGDGDAPHHGRVHVRLAVLDALRGRPGSARQHLLRCLDMTESDNVESRGGYAAAESSVALAEGNYRLALEAAVRALEETLRAGVAIANDPFRLAFPNAIDAAVGIPDLDEGERLVQLLISRPVGEVPPFLRLQVDRARALLGAARADDDLVEDNLQGAAQGFRNLGYPYWTARAQLDLAEWLARGGRVEEARTHAREAAATFEQLQVEPMLAKARSLLESEVAALLRES